MPGREKTLRLPCATHMLGGALHQLKDFYGVGETIPLGGVAGREADLEVADPRSSKLPSLCPLLDRLSNRRLAQASENTRVQSLS